eukprot:scaffold130512_cov72-Phaeocystis_antarctica.AAC.3
MHSCTRDAPLGHRGPNGRLLCGCEVRPKSPIPPLPPTAQIDADGSGTIEFDEFVKVIQMLHPLQATRRSAAEQAAAFDHLCLGGLISGSPTKKPSSPSKGGGGGDTRASLAELDDADRDEDANPEAEARLRLRSTVPRAAQRFAGAVVGNMRDSG